MNSANQSQLGKPVAYVDQYDAALLYPIPRASGRSALGLLGGQTLLPFLGADLWTAYELSWLTPRGKPQVALAHVTVPCESVNLIESKSLKLYLNSFSNTRFATASDVQACIRTDLSQALWRGAPVQAGVGISMLPPEQFDQQPVHELDGVNLDRLDIECTRYTPAPDLLAAALDEQPVSEVLVSNLLKSNCLVTGQPDWGAVQISYSGPQIDQAGLLQYIVSFRNHNEFHEQCVERMFMDIWQRCKPVKLTVYARYTRRGGLDINPFRTSHPLMLPRNIRTARQ
ncbi:MAG: 7-cyano-7-deazaguanine reductase [Pseudomonadota bacterium]|jgi:7-cyano-7-deazaguanine reductase